MENNYVVGILNIVEDKLREFNIQLPDEDREGSLDPIVGFQYAELHDRIKDYMEDAGLFPAPALEPRKTTVHMLSVVNSDGYADGKDSETSVYSSFQDFLDSAYALYETIWEESKQLEILDGNSPMLSKEAFKSEMLGIGCVCIQCLDAHVSFEYFEQELLLNRAHTQAQKPSLAAQIESSSSRSTNSNSHDNTPAKVSTDTFDR